MRDDAREEKTSFHKENRLTQEKLTGKDFKVIIHNGNWFKGRYFKVAYRKNNIGHIRYGFSVSGKAGNAVKRNLFRRRIKQLIRQTEKIVEIDIIVFPVGKLETSNYKGLKEDFEELTIKLTNGDEENKEK